ncbi:MAG TPA: hypothetical protein VJP86_12625 [Vicinamibacterales bacterium]|jgi:hypothetical protein|nr:hypothetical protein [Vicinamibacterales bacterium]
MNAKRLVGMFSICLCSTFAAAQLTGVAAQQNPTSQSQKDSDKDGNDAAKAVTADPKITLRGCLERTTASAAEPGTPVGTSGSEGSFALKNVTRVGPTAAKTLPSANSSSPTATGVSGAAGSAGAQGTNGAQSTGGNSVASGQIAEIYRIQADAAKLAPHVGQQVELTGSIESDQASTSTRQSGSTDAQSSGNSTQGGKVAGAAPILRVDDVKMIEASCSK